MAQGRNRVTVNATVVDSIYTLSNEVVIYFFLFLARVARQSAALSSATQHAMSQEFVRGERKVLNRNRVS